MESCVMCAEAAGVGAPLAYSDDVVSVFPARWQPAGNAGYSLLVTRAHVATLYELEDDDVAPVFRSVRDVARAVQSAFGADGTTIRQNNNPPGQEIDHLHFHIVPRFVGDDFWNAETHEVEMETRRRQAEALRSALTGSCSATSDT